MKFVRLLGIGFALMTSVQAADLEVVVEGVERVEGQLKIGIFNSEETFRNEPMEHSTTIEITEIGPITAIIEGLEPGVYAIAIVWDLNMNGEVDVSGPFKRPTEPTAFSNAPKLLFGPPKFEDCTFMVEEEGGRIEIVLVE